MIILKLCTAVVSSSHFTQIVAENIVMTRMCIFETHQEANGLLLSDVCNVYMPNVGCSSKLFSFCYSNRFLADLVQFIMILILCTVYTVQSGDAEQCNHSSL